MQIAERLINCLFVCAVFAHEFCFFLFVGDTCVRIQLKTKQDKLRAVFLMYESNARVGSEYTLLHNKNANV